MTTSEICAVFLLAAVAGMARTDAVKSEADLNRRAELAVDQAERDLDAARQAWQGGDWTKTQSALAALKESAELAGTSLQQTKQPPRNNRHYKAVELKMKNLIRRIDGFRLEVDYDQR